MKKLTSLILAIGLLASFTGCAKEAPAQAGPAGTPQEIIAKIYENHQPLQLRVDSLELDLSDADAVSYNTGLSDPASKLCISLSF